MFKVECLVLSANKEECPGAQVFRCPSDIGGVILTLSRKYTMEGSR